MPEQLIVSPDFSVQTDQQRPFDLEFENSASKAGPEMLKTKFSASFVSEVVERCHQKFSQFPFLREIQTAMIIKKIEVHHHFWKVPGKMPRPLAIVCITMASSRSQVFEAGTWADQHFSILNGCDVVPFADSLFHEHSAIIAGLLIGTTWKVLRFYVASILTAVIGNVGVPVALSFSLAEDTDLYGAFYIIFRALFNLNLSTDIIESD
jgi:hypothetical protein